MWQLALFRYSCISFWAKCFVPMSAGFSTSDTSTMVSSRRATASCTHKTWKWRCLTRPTPRFEAIAFDAVASTRKRGFATFVMSAVIASVQDSRCTLGQCVKLRSIRFSVVADETKRCPPSITYQDEVDRRVFAYPVQSLPEQTSTIGCSTYLLYTIKDLGLPFRNCTRRLTACMFLVFGCCIRPPVLSPRTAAHLS